MKTIPNYKSSRLLFAISIWSLLLGACQPEDITQLKSQTVFSHTVINRGDDFPETPQKLIMLGQKLNNPYKVSNMALAWNKAYPNYQVISLPVTHQQIQFDPQSAEEIISLEEAGVDLSMFPFGYEILNDGNYHIPPGKKEGDIPTLWSVVPIDIVLPDDAHYTVEEELCILPLATRVVMEAYRLAGLDYKEALIDELPATPPADPQSASFKKDLILLEANEVKEPMLLPPPPPGPGDAQYMDNGDGDRGLSESNCGCFKWSNEDKPAGCAKVEDTQWGVQPLVNAKVVFRDVFVIRHTQTNEHGCFKIDHDFWPWCWGFLEFTNSQATMRHFGTGPFWSIFLTHEDYLGDHMLTGSHTINDMDITYWKATNPDHVHTSYYTSATMINAVRTFHQYCAMDGISAPPQHMRILTLKGENISSAAPMMHQMGATGFYALAQGAVGPFWGTFLATVLGPLLQPIYNAIAPDIIYAYRFSSAAGYSSDRMRNIMYHELAHSSHFSSAGSHIWFDEIVFTVGNGPNDPYGENTVTNPLSAGHKRAQLIEGWAYFLADIYSHRTYGFYHHSNGFNIHANSYIAKLERNIKPYFMSYFPNGLFQDLRDKPSNYPAVTSYVWENSAVNDYIYQAYTISQMYHALGQNESMMGWKSDLPPSGQSQQYMDMLFNSYPNMQ